MKKEKLSDLIEEMIYEICEPHNVREWKVREIKEKIECLMPTNSISKEEI